MSQPSKRISFKVLKAKSESSNWVYAPGRNATLTDAALKVIGFEVASCCTLETKSSGTAQSGNGETSNYELIAFLPKANAGIYAFPYGHCIVTCLTVTDFSKVGYAGQFFSVDGRPLSTTRGIGSDIVKLYKSYLRSAASRSGHPTTISDPFICLHIRCPTGSYDANVEPAKDDVLFEDPRTVLSLVEDLFRNIYGDLEGSTGRETLPKRREKLPNNDGFELLMARKRPAGPSPQIGNANNSFKPLTIATPRSQFRSPLSVSTPGENIREQRNVDLAETPHTEDDTSSKDLEFLNPWSITKINAPLCTPERSQPRVEGNHCLTLSNTRQAFRQRPGGSERRYQGHMRSPALPSPSDSNASSTSPTALYCTPLSAQSSQMSPTASIQNSRKRNSRDHDKERDGNGALDTWLQTITPGASGQIPVEEQSDNDQGEPSFSQRVQEQFSLHGKSLLDTPESTARESSALCEPLDDISQKRQSSASVQETEVEKRGQGLPGFKTLSTILHRFPDTDNSSQLEKALDFERRKKQAMRKRREHMRSISKGDQIVSSSPHRRRYLAARAALSSDLNARTESEDVATSEKVPSAHRLNPNDPRAYLMRNRSNLSKEGMQIKRIRTGKLPFETIPEGHDLYNVCLTQPADMTLFSTSSREMLELDLYTQCPTEYQGFSASEPEEDLESWKHRLSTLIKNKYGPPDEENLEIDISSALTRHLIDLKDCWN